MNDYMCSCEYINGVQVHTCSNLEQSKEEKDWSKEWEKCKLAHIELMDRLVEQSKTPKEEQCYCFCHQKSPSLPKGSFCIHCEPKTEEHDRKVCNIPGCLKCWDMWRAEQKTEDTALNDLTKNIDESKHDYGEDTGECGNQLCDLCDVHCPAFEATGVSKKATNEDSHDTLSSSENKGIPIKLNPMKYAKEVSENKEESMEDRFEKEFGNPEWIWKQEKYKDFIQSEISKAVAKERELIIKEVKLVTGRNTYGHFDKKLGDRIAIDYELFIKDLLSLLNSKKGQHG